MESLKKAENESFFWGIYTFWFSVNLMNLSNLDSVAGIDFEIINLFADCIVLALLLVYIVCRQSYTRRELVVIAAVTIVIGTSVVISQGYNLMGVWLFVIAMKTAEPDRVVRYARKMLLAAIPIIVLLRVTGVIEDSVRYRNGVARYSLGFTHPNTLGQVLFHLLACHFYIRGQQVRKRDYAFVLAAAVFSYAVPNSQASYVCLIALFVVFLAWRLLRRFGERVRKIYGYGLVGIAALLNAVSIVWSVGGIKAGTLAARINTLVSIRFSACHRVYEIYGIKLLGNVVKVGEDYAAEYLYLDNGYMALLLRFGVFVYLIFSAAFLALMVRCVRHRQMALLLVLFVYAMYGVIECGIYQVTENVFLLYLSALLYRGRAAAPGEKLIYLPELLGRKCRLKNTD